MPNHALCPTCGAIYEISAYYAGEQDVCPLCVAARRRAMTQPTEEQKREQDERRRKAYGTS